MSESKLKRTFKSRFGATVFDYGLGCRMHHALQLLRRRRCRWARSAAQSDIDTRPALLQLSSSSSDSCRARRVPKCT